jgi:hypothetical protein
VLPMLARNVSLHGYENDRPTEYLVLIDRYVQLARELQSLAGADGTIRVAGCDDAAGLIQILGYRFQQGCGPNGASLVTENPRRAFLTIDSGFPITALEEALQKGTPFTFAFPATRVPVLFSEKTWIALSEGKREDRKISLTSLLRDRDVDRLYSALARTDQQTRLALVRSPGLRKLLPLGAVLDFYGSRICIRSGQVSVPNGASSEQAWKELVGASPKSPGEFVTHLLAGDHGWMAAYFDALSRVVPSQQAHLAEPDRLHRLYDAYRLAPVTQASPVRRQVSSQGMPGSWCSSLVCNGRPTASLRFQGILKSGRRSSPANPRGSGSRVWATRTRSWDNPEKLLEALVASSSAESATTPLRIYLALSAIDQGRPQGRSCLMELYGLLASKFYEFNSWYPIFAEFPALDDESIASFVERRNESTRPQAPALRSNALGAFQADIGLWQIFARQGQIPTMS